MSVRYSLYCIIGCVAGPLQKVLHLYAVLGNLNSYHDSYRASRDATLRNLMQQVLMFIATAKNKKSMKRWTARHRQTRARRA